MNALLTDWTSRDGSVHRRYFDVRALMGDRLKVVTYHGGSGIAQAELDEKKISTTTATKILASKVWIDDDGSLDYKDCQDSVYDEAEKRLPSLLQKPVQYVVTDPTETHEGRDISEEVVFTGKVIYVETAKAAVVEQPKNHCFTHTLMQRAWQIARQMAGGKTGSKKFLSAAIKAARLEV